MSFFLDDEETLDEPYGEIWRRVDLSPERIAERERCRKAAAKLFAELGPVIRTIDLRSCYLSIDSNRSFSRVAHSAKSNA